MIPQPVRFKGAPGSPYTRKMMAFLRYRHIPYELLIGEQADRMGMPQPKVSLLPTFYLPGDNGELEALVDSTPLIRRFESEIEGRSVLPADSALAFINYLLEDYGDEWLTKPMFHYRWQYDADIDMAGKILPLWRNLQMPADVHDKASRSITDRQVSRLYVVGSNETTAPVIEDSYKRFVGIMDALIQRQPFLMGERPGSADFAFYAQLTQLAKFDPTPQSICLETAPRVYAWTDVMDDLSGLQVDGDTGWMSVDAVRDLLHDLLCEVGRTYVPAMLANAAALQQGSDAMETEIDGRPWTQPTFPYQGKCLQWVREKYAALDENARHTVDAILVGTGCERLLIY